MNFRIIAVLASESESRLLQAKDNPTGISPKQTLMLSEPTVVAGTQLPVTGIQGDA